MSKDYYEILGISKSASFEEIKRAYRKLAQEFHPDKGGDPEKFKEVSEAYQVLSDSQRRAQYDKFGTTFEQAKAGGGFSGFDGFRDFSSFAEAFDFFGQDRGKRAENGFGFEDIFEGIFGGRAKRASGRAQRGGGRGQDISVDVEISLMDAFQGVDKEIELYKLAVCPKCRGGGAEPGSKIKECSRCRGQGQVEERRSGGFFSFSQIRTCPICQGAGKKPEKNCVKCGGDGRVKEQKAIGFKIPAGIQDGQVISIAGQGEAGLFGAPAGDLYATVRIRRDPRFRREGDAILYELRLSFAQAALGAKIEVPTLSGSVNLKIPEGIETGRAIRLEGKGMPRLSHRGFGDMIVNVTIKTPKRLSKKAKELLEELKKEIE